MDWIFSERDLAQRLEMQREKEKRNIVQQRTSIMDINSLNNSDFVSLKHIQTHCGEETLCQPSTGRINKNVFISSSSCSVGFIFGCQFINQFYIGLHGRRLKFPDCHYVSRATKKNTYNEPRRTDMCVSCQADYRPVLIFYMKNSSNWLKFD